MRIRTRIIQNEEITVWKNKKIFINNINFKEL